MLSDNLRWIFGVLAAFRLTWELAVEDGPWGVWFKLRERLGAYEYGPEKENGEPIPETRLGQWVSCKYCLAFFPVAPIVTGLVAIAWLPTDFIIAWLGIAGAVTLMIRWRPWRNT